jgi:hypothetical protein
VLASGIPVPGGIISKTVWGLRNIDAFGFKHIKVGNNSAEVIKAVIDGISAFRDKRITPAILNDYLQKKKTADVPAEEREYLGLPEDLLKVYNYPGHHFHTADRASYPHHQIITESFIDSGRKR